MNLLPSCEVGVRKILLANSNSGCFSLYYSHFVILSGAKNLSQTPAISEILRFAQTL